MIEMQIFNSKSTHSSTQFIKASIGEMDSLPESTNAHSSESLHFPVTNDVSEFEASSSMMTPPQPRSNRALAGAGQGCGRGLRSPVLGARQGVPVGAVVGQGGAIPIGQGHGGSVGSIFPAEKYCLKKDDYAKIVDWLQILENFVIFHGCNRSNSTHVNKKTCFKLMACFVTCCWLFTTSVNWGQTSTSVLSITQLDTS